MSIAPLPSVSQVAAAQRPANDARSAAGSAQAAAAPSGSTAPLLNPDPVIDASLGIVVLQYFSNAGDLTQTFPSRQQLDSYEIYGLKGPDATG